MKFVTLVRGDTYRKIAELTVPLFERSTGEKATVVELEDNADHFREKLRLFERFDEPLFFFDLDCLFLKSWKLERNDSLRMAKGAVWGAAPPLANGRVMERVYNTGIFFANPTHAPLFERALQVYDKSDGKYFDEGPLCVAIAEYDVNVDELSSRFNCQRSKTPPEDTVVWHLVGRSGVLKAGLMRQAAKTIGLDISINSRLLVYAQEHLVEKSWVDIGARDGRVSRSLSKACGGSFACIDINPTEPSVAAFDGKSISGSYDVALLNFVLHHTADPEALLREALRVARTVVIQEDVPDGTAETDRRLREHATGQFRTPEQWSATAARLGAATVHSEAHGAWAQHALGIGAPRHLLVIQRG